MAELAKLLIDGKWVPASDGASAVAVDPGRDRSVGAYAVGTIDDMDAAIAAANQTFKATDWRRSPRVRAKVLLEMAERLQANQQVIAKAISAENGKLYREAAHEVAVSVSELQYYAGLARNIFGRVMEVEPNLYSTLAMEPLGVAGVE